MATLLPATDYAPVVTTLRSAGCVFAEDEARLLTEAAETPEQLADLVAKRVAGQPLEHLLGWVDFAGLRIAVAPGVFVPRQRTELLIESAVARAAGRRRPLVVLDLCCGTGALGVTLAARLREVELHATDIEPAAVRCARGNIEPLEGHVYEGDLYQPLPATLKGRIDILAANAPYVPTGSIALMPREARLHEPQVALDGGDDGCHVIRRVMSEAAGWLAPGGAVLVESSEQQSAELVSVVAAAGLRPAVIRDQDRGATVVSGTRLS